MTSVAAEPIGGAQEPRVRNVPEYESSSGTEAIEFCESFGLILDPWQQLCVMDMLGERPDGLWAAMEFALLVARQNGKGSILLARELSGLYLFGEALTLHSAHEFKTASEAFLRLKFYVDASDFLRKRVKRMPTAHGEEGLELTTGPRLRFIARSRSSGRGFTGNCTIADEAQELPDTSLQALAPTMSAVPNPQIIYTGTVPTPENNSEVWTRIRDRGRRGGDETLAWLEWNAGERAPMTLRLPDGQMGENLDDPAALTAANPALGYRLTERYVRSVERGSMSDRAFARERLSLWASGRVDMIIPGEVWDALADPTSEIVGPMALGLGMPFDRRTAVIAAAGRRADGLLHIEIVDQNPRSDWVLPRLQELVTKHDVRVIVIDPGSAAASLLPDVEAAFEEVPGSDVTQPVVLKTSSREYAQATGALYDAAMAPAPDLSPDAVNQQLAALAIEEETGVPLGTLPDDGFERALPGEAPTPRPRQPGRLRHLGDPILRAALEGASKRPLAGLWTWNAVESGDDVSPLQAVSLAAFGLATVPAEEETEVWGFWS